MSNNMSPKSMLLGGVGATVIMFAGYTLFASYVAGGNDPNLQKPSEKIDASSYRLPQPDDKVAYTFHQDEPKPQEKLPYNEPEKRKDTYQPQSYAAPAPRQKAEPAKKLNIGFGENETQQSSQHEMLAAYSRVQPNGNGYNQPMSERGEISATRQNLVNESRSFLANASQMAGTGVIRNSVQPAVSEYFLQTGLIIKMLALNAASTRQPGGLAAKVPYDVKDSRTQSCTLIPAGTVVYGPVNNQVAYGGDTMQAPFTRLHFPNGDIMDIEGMPATGIDGKPGVNGRVNRHVWNMALAVLGEAFFTTLGQAGQIVNDGEQTIVSVGANAVGSSTSSVGAEIIRRQLDLQNEIYIKQNDELAFMVTSDIPLPPYYGDCD